MMSLAAAIFVVVVASTSIFFLFFFLLPACPMHCLHLCYTLTQETEVWRWQHFILHMSLLEPFCSILLDQGYQVQDDKGHK